MPLSVSSVALVAALSGAAHALDGIANFRAVSPSLPGVYRSAALDRATAADVANILDHYKIRTIIDLRNTDEIEKAQARSSDFGRALLAAYERGDAVGSGQPASEGGGCLRRYHVPLLSNTEGFFDEVAKRMSPARQAEAAVYRTFSGKKYDALLYDEVARGKQFLLYTVMLATSPNWQRALSLTADRRDGCVLFHCAQGKDRTGILAALLQHSVDESEQQLVDGYAASEALLLGVQQDSSLNAAAGDAAGTEQKQEGAAGVDWSALRGSPPEAMTKTLEWIRQEHGSIDGFLASVGCGDSWRQTLRTARPTLL